MKKQYTKFRLSEIIIKSPDLLYDTISIKDVLKDVLFIGFEEERQIGGDVFHN